MVGNGDKRFGWMAQDALTVSAGCPLKLARMTHDVEERGLRGAWALVAPR